MENTTSQRAADGEVTCEQCKYFTIKNDGPFTKRRCILYRTAPVAVCYDFRKAKNAGEKNIVHGLGEGSGEGETALRKEDGGRTHTTEDKKL